jgi:hypothetical protein
MCNKNTIQIRTKTNDPFAYNRSKKTTKVKTRRHALSAEILQQKVPMICPRLSFCLAFQAAFACGHGFRAPRARVAIRVSPRRRWETISAGYADIGAGAEGGWRRVPCAKTNALKDCAAVLNTADFDRSDPRLAGLMLRCGAQGIETVLIVVEPFSPHALPRIILVCERRKTPPQWVGWRAFQKRWLGLISNVAKNRTLPFGNFGMILVLQL